MNSEEFNSELIGDKPLHCKLHWSSLTWYFCETIQLSGRMKDMNL